MSTASSMSAYTLRIEMRSFWHYGTGGERGAMIDAICKRDKAGLPMIGGRAIKGLLRESVRMAEKMEWLDPPIFAGLFGDDTSSGRIRVSSAFLLNKAQLSAASEAQKATLFQLMHSTAIDSATHTATPKTLRCIEVALPVPLVAEVLLSDADAAAVKLALPLFTELGGKRARGFGRCVVLLEKQS